MARFINAVKRAGAAPHKFYFSIQLDSISMDDISDSEQNLSSIFLATTSTAQSSHANSSPSSRVKSPLKKKSPRKFASTVQPVNTPISSSEPAMECVSSLNSDSRRITGATSPSSERNSPSEAQIQWTFSRGPKKNSTGLYSIPFEELKGNSLQLREELVPTLELTATLYEDGKSRSLQSKKAKITLKSFGKEESLEGCVVGQGDIDLAEHAWHVFNSNSEGGILSEPPIPFEFFLITRVGTALRVSGFLTCQFLKDPTFLDFETSFSHMTVNSSAISPIKGENLSNYLDSPRRIGDRDESSNQISFSSRDELDGSNFPIIQDEILQGKLKKQIEAEQRLLKQISSMELEISSVKSKNSKLQDMYNQLETNLVKTKIELVNAVDRLHMLEHLNMRLSKELNISPDALLKKFDRRYPEYPITGSTL